MKNASESMRLRLQLVALALFAGALLAMGQGQAGTLGRANPPSGGMLSATVPQVGPP
jgi:hypothetical protein